MSVLPGRCALKPITAALSLLLLASIPIARGASIARVWNDEILAAIRIDLPHPPVHARNLFHLSVAMYDAWAAYDSNAVGYLYHAKHAAPDIEAARREAISYAAYRVLAERYALSRNASNTLHRLASKMEVLGYPTNVTSLDSNTAAGLGNLIAATVSGYFIEDGSRQLQRYADYPYEQGGYAPTNRPLITGDRGTLAVDVNRWQPLAITNAVSQNDLPVDIIQPFLGAQWLGVRPFALSRTDNTRPWLDPGPPPRLNGTNHQKFRDEVVDVIRKSSEMTPADGVLMDISPGAFGNSSLGTNDGTGHPLNPATGQPYAPNVVKRGDFARVLAEFWADGPQSETPPGHWNTLANEAVEHPSFQRRLGGTGPLLDPLEWDVKMYFALNGALHDAACVAWSLKRYYDSSRPITMIRYMGERGQSTDPGGVNYHPEGLPLVPGLIELVTPPSAAPGQRHAGFPLGIVVIRCWPGQPANPSNQISGVVWKRPGDWFTYQKKNFVSPAFPGFVSGHSTFSRAAAEVLTAMTGSPFFPGGLATFTASSNAYLSVELGPSQTVQLQWATYYDAADQAGMSRIWGGIHVQSDDFTGRRLGSVAGTNAWALARKYFDGSILRSEVRLALHRLGNGAQRLEFNAVRGFRYELQSATDLNLPFPASGTDLGVATDTRLRLTNSAAGAQSYFRVQRVNAR
jgi:hypothetical protein